MSKKSTPKAAAKSTPGRSKKAACPAMPEDPAAALREAAMSDGERGRRTRDLLHQTLLSRVYFDHLKAVIAPQPALDALVEPSRQLVDDLAATVRPTDALEQMLVEQAMWTHARTAHLSLQATQTNDIDTLVSLSAATDRASNSFRRLMLALKDYRQPVRPAANHTSIGQANIAAQQVVQAAGTAISPENATNELGMDACPKSMPLNEPVDPTKPSSPPQPSPAQGRRQRRRAATA